MNQPAPPVFFSDNRPLQLPPPPGREPRCLWFLGEETGKTCNETAPERIRINLVQCDVLVPVCHKHKQIFNHKARQMRMSRR